MHRGKYLAPVFGVVAAAEVIPLLPGSIHSREPYLLSVQHEFVVLYVDVYIFGRLGSVCA